MESGASSSKKRFSNQRNVFDMSTSNAPADQDRKRNESCDISVTAALFFLHKDERTKHMEKYDLSFDVLLVIGSALPSELTFFSAVLLATLQANIVLYPSCQMNDDAIPISKEQIRPLELVLE
jgi:hypothetical protein